MNGLEPKGHKLMVNKARGSERPAYPLWRILWIFVRIVSKAAKNEGILHNIPSFFAAYSML